jgi:hypothetical protein
MSDILGVRPDPKTGDLNSALTELRNAIGLESVKIQIQEMVLLATSNYERELLGDEPLPSTLNKVFFGNPGTGKTTVAKLYGRILKGLGFLSDGQFVLKQPKDLIGQHIGETEKKTAALIENCSGKVLIIDEAYGLMGSSYGTDAINTLVGLVHNAPGEDIAVVMIGYEKDLRKMFSQMNAGLARRFSLDSPFTFED